jgi:hypothetical protein
MLKRRLPLLALALCLVGLCLAARAPSASDRPGTLHAERHHSNTAQSSNKTNQHKLGLRRSSEEVQPVLMLPDLVQVPLPDISVPVRERHPHFAQALLLSQLSPRAPPSATTLS